MIPKIINQGKNVYSAAAPILLLTSPPHLLVKYAVFKINWTRQTINKYNANLGNIEFL
jgi:hypothetical protein